MPNMGPLCHTHELDEGPVVHRHEPSYLGERVDLKFFYFLSYATFMPNLGYLQGVQKFPRQVMHPFSQLYVDGS